MRQPFFLGLSASRSWIALICLATWSFGCSDKSASRGSDSTTEEGGSPGTGDSDDDTSGKTDPDITIVVRDETVSCEEDDECNDGNPCNGEESCREGFCASGKAINCNDGIACTIDSCDPSSGVCQHEPIDADQDGEAAATCLDMNDVPLGDDCDDEDPDRFPGNIEVCLVQLAGDSTTLIGDGIDEDCDPTTVGERDVDGDGYIDSVCFNVDDEGNRTEGRDCDDSNASTSPLASEVCDHFDNNCNGKIDEGLTIKLYDDPDRDGYGGVVDPDSPDDVILAEREVCPGEVGVTDVAIDCAPNDRLVSPDRAELCDGVDNDCDGEVDENVTPSIWYRDFDGDGWGNAEGGIKSTCERIDHLGWSLFLGDCDDGNPLVNPGQSEICDGLDNDCNPATTFLITASDAEDDDGDGVPDPDCGLTLQDCNDSNSTVYPGARELCDGIDNDCNGVKDTSTTIVKWYIDADGDGFGATAGAIESCEPVAKRVTKGNDCDDKNPKTHPGSKDDCTGQHGVDDDCDGDTDEGETPVFAYRDLDSDGYGSEPVQSFCVPVSGSEYAKFGNDCNEADAKINPGKAEVCSPASTDDLDCDGAPGCQDTQCFEVEACQALYGLQLVSPAQSPMVAFVSQTFDVTVSLTDFDQNPIAGQPVQVTGPGATLVPSAPTETDSSGQVTFTIGVGMAEGAYQFTVTSGSTDALKFTVNAQYPTEGTVWTVLNRMALNSSSTVESRFGPNGSTYYPRDIRVASDGSAYIAGYFDVLHMDRFGQVKKIAGNGSGSLTGDGGPSLSAGLGYPRWLSLDESKNILYIATTSVVRAVKLGASPPTIHHAIGGGDGQVPGVAELADIGTIYGMEILPNGHLLVSATVGVLEYDPAPTSKRLSLYGLTVGEFSSSYVAPSYTGLGLWQTGSKTIFWGNYLAGGDFGSSGVRGIGAKDGDSSYRMIGRYGSTPNLEMMDGSHLDNSYIYGAVQSALTDSRGNLLFANGQGVVWKVDTVTQRASIFAGTYESNGAGSDYVPRANAQFLAGEWSTDVGPDGDIWIAEYSAGGRVRRIRKGAQGSRSTLKLSILSADGASYWPGESIDPTVSEARDGEDELVLGAIVHQQPQGGWVPLISRDDTDIDGVSFTGGRANVSMGDYSLQTQLRDLDGDVTSADVLSYKVVRPNAGALTSWSNAEHSSSNVSGSLAGLPAITTPIYPISNMTVAGDGSVYLSTSSYQHLVVRITPDGILEPIAGGNGGSNNGDGLQALSAAIGYPSHLALDDEENRLYISAGSGTQRIRVVDLDTGIISAFAGHGNSTGVGIAAADRAPWTTYDVKFHDGILYVVSANGIETIDTTTSAPTIEMWSPKGACSDPLAIYSLSSNSNSLTFSQDGHIYLHAYLCGTSVTGTYAYGVMELDSDGSPIELLTGDGSLVYDGEHDASEADGTYSQGVAVDSKGNIYFTEYTRHWLRKLTPNGILSTVAGSPTQAYGGQDFTDGLSARMYYPNRIEVMPDDSVLILDSSNYCLRRYWP